MKQPLFLIFLAVVCVKAAQVDRCSDVADCATCVTSTSSDGACGWCASTWKCDYVNIVAGHYCRRGSILSNPVNCRDPKGEYNETFARNIMFPLAAAAYNSNPLPCITSTLGSDARLIETFVVPCNLHPNQTCSAYIAVSPLYRAIIIAFRGSLGPLQAICIGCQQSNYLAVSSGNTYSAALSVNTYMLDAFQHFWNDGLRYAVWQQYFLNQGYTLWYTGHSLGGGLAHIFAAHFSFYYFDSATAYNWPELYWKTILYTFAQPKVGDELYKNWHEQQVFSAYRIINSQDPVAILPFNPRRFYFHNRIIMRYPNETMSFNADRIECFDSRDCIDEFTFLGDPLSCNSCTGKGSFNFDLHTIYYTIDVRKFGEQNCTIDVDAVEKSFMKKPKDDDVRADMFFIVDNTKNNTIVFDQITQVILNFTQNYASPEANRVALYAPLRDDYYGFDVGITQPILASFMRLYAQQLPATSTRFSIANALQMMLNDSYRQDVALPIFILTQSPLDDPTFRDLPGLLQDLHYNGLQIIVITFNNLHQSEIVKWRNFADILLDANRFQQVDLELQMIQIVLNAYGYHICIPRLSPCLL